MRGNCYTQHLMPAVAPTASWVQPWMGPIGQPHNLTDVLASETSFPYLELAFRISVVNSDTAQKGTSTE